MANLSDSALQALNNCTVLGNVVKLGEEQLDRKVYVEVKNALEKIGGSWKGGKISGFMFDHDPTDLLSDIQGGKQRNLKKEFQFFATPIVLAHHLVTLAEIEDGMSVLEPSAGHGAIIEAIYAKFPRAMEGPNDKPCVTVDYCELMPQNKEILFRKGSESANWRSRTSFMEDDFLKLGTNWQYDRVVANPPFTNNQDIDHIMKMYQHLKPGGILVSIASVHWITSSNKKETVFRDFINGHKEFAIMPLPAGEFKESGTNIAACIVKIVKP